ncbi:MAG: polysaccharide deacetylase family protein [Proteobacteria bacterium]|nr:polysaccharide deacetylase family protein [Pseudomonadota bacterium]
MMFKNICLMLFTIVFFSVSSVYAEEMKGGIVLAFDDGYSSWINVIAPELSRVGGVATGFVNNQRIHAGDLSFEDLRTLQNKYGWEIGTHTYHHFNSPEFVKRKGISSWVKDELEASITELTYQRLKVQSMVFPFNYFTPELGAEVIKKLEAFRRADAFPIAKGKRADGSYPSTPIDIAHYVPLEQVLSWIDLAQQQKRFIFLYGHKVLPDEEFVTGTVASCSGRTLVAQEIIGPLPRDKELCLVPDTRRRIYGFPIKIESVEGNVITIFQGDLSPLTKPGATFLIGQSYGTQISYFRELINYAAKRLPFLTVHGAIETSLKKQ